jgi:hypothetical protein
MAADGYGGELFVGDLDAGGVVAVVEVSAD